MNNKPAFITGGIVNVSIDVITNIKGDLIVQLDKLNELTNVTVGLEFAKGESISIVKEIVEGQPLNEWRTIEYKREENN